MHSLSAGKIALMQKICCMLTIREYVIVNKKNQMQMALNVFGMMCNSNIQIDFLTVKAVR